MLLGFAREEAGADWPAARGNGGRTAAVESGPPVVLVEGWTLSTPPPTPAWTGEARGSLWQHIPQALTARAADDQAPVPILAQGLVVFATTHDEVRAVEMATGRTRWRYFCGAPVRFAPAAAGERVFVGSDDGLVHALELNSGKSVWTVRIGPDQPWISGNGRLISPCPVRTGLLVSDGVVYVGAGLFPLEGTYLTALDAGDGRVRWRRHLGALSPQGYLADAGSELVIPLGRASPKIYRKRDGAPVRDVPSASGTFAVVSENETLAGPGPTGSIQAGDARTGAKLVSYPGRQMAVTPGTVYLVNGFELTALDRRILRESRGNLEKALRWKAECGGGAALIVAGDRVYAGTREAVEVLDATTGARRQTLPMPGPVAALAADTHGLVAVTREGVIRAFLPRFDPPAPPPPHSPVRAPATLQASVAEWTAALSSPRGLALWTGPGDPLPTLAALVAATSLHIVLAVPEAQVAALRQSLADEGWLGVRASVVARRGDGSVPLADHLVNLVIAGDLSAQEAVRLACPGPSGVLVSSGQTSAAPADAESGTWTHLYGTAANVCASAQALTGFPRLQWFGGHGPERMPDRHTRGHAPLAAGGLLVSMAENALIATDARNGTVRWQVELPESMRYAMPYDGGYAALREDGSRAFVAVNDTVWEIEGRTGAVSQRTPVPMPSLHWGWLALEGAAVYGSGQSATASRTVKEYDLVDLEYRSERPLVCSRGLFRLATSGSSAGWVHATPGLLVNATLCVSRGRLYAVEARGPAARTNAVGRLTCAQILEDAVVVCRDGETGNPLWEQPLKWPEARDILGLSVMGDRLVLSAAQSVGQQAAYHLRCWSTQDGRELWRNHGLNPIKDLFHGQQVKRPVVLRNRVAFESDLFDLNTGARWVPPGVASDWILSRPGHACGGMTGAQDGLLFRADNPTFFRFADGSFTRLAPTRPGCWLNILPVQGGVLIPEASASCICEYPVQTSMGFVFRPEPVPRLEDVLLNP